jgi:hypothetical protein
MHPSELAELEREAHWDRTRQAPRVASGSAEEEKALARIDELREDDEAGIMRRHPDMMTLGGARRFYRRGAPVSSLRTRRAQATKYWRRHARD